MKNIHTLAIKILHLEDTPFDAELVDRSLRQGGILFEKRVVANKADFENALSNFLPDIILSDHNLPHFDSVEALEIVQQRSEKTPFILITGAMSEEFAVSVMKKGAYDYILKGKLQRLSTSVLNAMEKKLAEKERKRFLDITIQNEKHFRALIENTTDMITLSSPAGEILYIRPSIKKVFGYTLEDFPKALTANFIHPDDIVAYLQKRDNILQNPGASTNNQQRLLHNNGNWVWYDVTITNMLLDPSVNALVANFRDISDKKIAEEKHEFDRNNLYALINNTNDLMWSVDRNFNLITCNDRFSEMISLNSGIPIEETCAELPKKIVKEQLAKFTKYYDRAFAGENFNAIEYTALPVEAWAEISFYPIRVGDSIVGAACHSHDITDRKKRDNLLKKSESFNRGVLNSLSSHIALVDNTGKILTVNETWKNFALDNGGTQIETGEGSNYFKVCFNAAQSGDTIAAEVMEGMKDVLADKSPAFYLEYPCHSPDMKRWFGMRVIKFDSEESLVVVSHQDISERKLAEENLFQSEAGLRMAQAIALMGSWEIDMISHKHIWSEGMYNMFGLDNKLKGSITLFYSIIHPDDVAFATANVEKSFVTLQGSTFDFRFFGKDGGIRYCTTEYRFDFDNNGNPIRLYGIVQDITERKLAEETMLLTQFALDNTGDGVFWMTPEATIFNANEAACAMLGYTKEEMLQLTVPDIVPNYDIVQWQAHFEELKNEGSLFFEIMQQTKDGRLIPVEIRANYIKHGDKEFNCAFTRDITERKNAALIQEKTIKDIISRNKDLEQFSYIVSHNLRSPVSNIIGITNALLSNQMAPEKETKMRGFLAESAEKLDEVIKDLNLVLQVRGDAFEAKEPVVFKRLLEEVIFSIGSIIEKEEIRVIGDFAKVDAIETIKSYLHSIFFNLISNSIKYRQPNTGLVIAITSNKIGNKTSLTFKDNGLGIDMEKQGQHVFGLYKRFHSHTEGRGMGLYMVKTQVEKLGGTIAMQSEVNKGTEITIEF
ncbi:PAS domain S-box protein [Parasediminibacterium sp. JCM 36343]|uniref:PAS domain S-box protein n=1 Tax=Parasediminibacterium sp. JCM 36343 TaxID=3374279 RepID=UPI00397A22CE